jgi:hypothetical protein
LLDAFTVAWATVVAWANTFTHVAGNIIERNAVDVGLIGPVGPFLRTALLGPEVSREQFPAFPLIAIDIPFAKWNQAKT